MRQKKSFCNAALLRSDLRRTWPVLFAYVFIWLLILPIPILRLNGTEAPELRGQVELCLCDGMSAAEYMGLAFGVVWAMTLLFYLMNGRSVGLLHSLPATRSCQLRTHLLAGIGSTFAANVLIFVMALLAQARVGAVAWEHSLQWLLVSTVVFLFFFALGTFCSMLTGWLLAVPVLYGAVQCAAFLINGLVQTLESIFYLGFDGSVTPELVKWLTPAKKLYWALDCDSTYETYMQGKYEIRYLVSATLVKGAIGTVLIYGAVAVVLLVVSDWLLGLRRSEVAGDALAFRPMGPVVRWTVGILGGMGLGILLLSIVDGTVDSTPLSVVSLIICQIIMGVICFLATQMLIRKSLRVFRESWKEVAALCVALIAITIAVKMDLGGFQKRVPEANTVQTVRVAVHIYGQEGSCGVITGDADVIEATTAAHSAVVKQLSPNAGKNTGYFRVEYTLKNGGSLSRVYYLTGQENQELEKLVNLPQMRRSLVMNDFDGVPEDIMGGYIYPRAEGQEQDMDTDQARRLYEAVLKDMDNMSLSIQGDYNSCMLYISLFTRDATDNGESIDINLNTQCTNALNLLTEFGFIESPAAAFEKGTTRDSQQVAGIGLPEAETRTIPG